MTTPNKTEIFSRYSYLRHLWTHDRLPADMALIDLPELYEQAVTIGQAFAADLIFELWLAVQEKHDYDKLVAT